MADQMLTELDAVSSVGATDLVYVVVDPAGTPADKKITVANLMKSESDPLVKAIVGIVKSNGSLISAASDGTDYLSPTAGVTVSQSTPQTIGATGSRLLKLWATDVTVTNAIAGSVTGNAGTVTNATLTTALTVNTGTVTISGNAANSSVLTIGAGAVSVSGTNTGDQTLPVKAIGSEVDTGTDDAKFVTAKAIADSHNVPSVAPSTSGNVMTSNGTDWVSSTPTAGGTVTDVSVTTANGISGSVATSTTTPAITLTLGNITPTTVNGLTLASQAIGFTIAGGTTSKTLTVPLDASVAGTNTGDQDLSGLVTKATYDAHTILAATTDNTPIAVVVGEQRVVGRVTGGNITDLLIDSDLSSVSANDDSIPSAKATKTMGDSKKPWHGIEAAGALSFDNSTHILSIASGTNTYWYLGTKYTTASAITCDLDSFVTLTDNTLYFVYFDDASGTLKAGTTFWDLYTKVPVATVLWNGSAGAVIKETHDKERSIGWHVNAHLTIGTRYYSGLAQTAPTTAADATLTIGAGTLYDEELALTITEQSTMRGLYQASAGVYTFADYALPYVGTSGQPQFLDTDTYALANVGASDYVCMWVYGCGDIARPIYIIPTHAATAYNTLALARAETVPVLSALNISSEMKLLYRWIYKGDGQYQEGVDYRNASSLPAGGSSAVNATSVSFAPAGNIAATNVQAAIEELDTEKAAVAQTFYIGTTQVAINRASAALTLAGLTLTTPDIGTPSAGVLTNCTGSPTLTSPKITTSINDTNNNEVLIVTATGSAVNEITIANGATGNNATLTASGETNTGITITGKGTKGVSIGNALIEKTVTVTDGAGFVCDTSLGNEFFIDAAADRTMGTPTNMVNGMHWTLLFKANGGARTLTLPTASAGDCQFGSDITAITATASGKTDMIRFYYNSTAGRNLVVAYVKGFTI